MPPTQEHLIDINDKLTKRFNRYIMVYTQLCYYQIEKFILLYITSEDDIKP